MTGGPKRKTWSCVAVCGLVALANAALIVLESGAPDATAKALELAWSCAPLACLALLAFVARKDPISSWAVLLICVPLAVYDGVCYWNAFRLAEYESELRRVMPGFTFGGHILGFGLFIAWPATLLAAAVVLIRRGRGIRERFGLELPEG